MQNRSQVRPNQRLYEEYDQVVIRQSIASRRRAIGMNGLVQWIRMAVIITSAIALIALVVVYLVNFLSPWKWMDEQQLRIVWGWLKYIGVYVSALLIGRTRVLEHLFLGEIEGTSLPDPPGKEEV